MGTSFQEVFSQQISGVDSVFSLIFPRKCANCDKEMAKNQNILCFGCESKINWSKSLEREISNQILQGVNVPNVKNAFSLFCFTKEGVEQVLIHRLKYQNSRQTGVFLGQKLGKSIQGLMTEIQLDCLIPVPIFHRKKFDRGYNQALSIAKGLSSQLNVPVWTSLLRKKKKTKSQTKLSRDDRRTNVENSFVATNAFSKLNSIGIVDDVVTTGATIGELCREITLVNDSIKITIFTLGVARIE